jgi:hypothetical protein
VIWDAPKDLGYELHVDSIHQDSDGRLVVSVAGEEPYEVCFEVWLAKGSIALAADGKSVQQTMANKRMESNG